MTRHRPFVPLLALLLVGLAVPSASQAKLTVLQDQEDAEPVNLVSFKSAKCRKASKKKALLKFHAGARKSGYVLSVNVWKKGRKLNIEFGQDSPVDINLSGPAGSWSTLNRPPTGFGAGALHFNSRKKTKMGIGFSPIFNDSFTNTISMAGSLKCKYKKKRRRR